MHVAVGRKIIPVLAAMLRKVLCSDDDDDDGDDGDDRDDRHSYMCVW